MPRPYFRATQFEFVGLGSKIQLRKYNTSVSTALETNCKVQQGLGNHWPNLLLCDLKQYCMYTVFGFIL